MRVAVVHYHYRPGGVTRVVENAVESLQGRGVTVIAIGGEPYSGQRLPVRMQPGLGYSLRNEKLSPGPLWYSLKMVARQALGGEPDLWHFHNHALGKNSAIGEVVAKMAVDAPVLLQMHDFAEDGRSSNYAMLKERMDNMAKLYPQGSQVHYATINQRDRNTLLQSGFAAGNVHLLPNPVRLEKAPALDPLDIVEGDCSGLEFVREGQALYLYPTRGIRRKNLGEFLLWAATFGKARDACFATTLLPQSEPALAVHERWRALAGKLGLPVAFGVGSGRRAPSLQMLMERASAAVTTSVSEGFGMAFLEPYLFDRPVYGRNLPEITDDFSAQGIDLSSLYSRLLIPADMVSELLLRQKLTVAMQRTYREYGMSMPADAVERCLVAMADGKGRIDFGRLDEELQEEVISQLLASPALAAQMQPPMSLLDGNVTPDQIARNRQAVETRFGLAQYGARLQQLYTEVAGSPKSQLEFAGPERLLSAFLAPERFNLLCS